MPTYANRIFHHNFKEGIRYLQSRWDLFSCTSEYYDSNDMPQKALIVKTYSPNPNKNDTDTFKYYLVDKKQLLGKGNFGKVYAAWELDASTGSLKYYKRHGTMMPPKPLVAKLITKPDTLAYHKWCQPDRVLYNEFTIQAQQDPTSMSAVFFKKLSHLKTPAPASEKSISCMISEFIPDAHVATDALTDPSLSLVTRLRYLLQLALKLEKMHCQATPIVHRDLKFSNISAHPSVGAQLYDWGLATPVNANDDHTPATLYATHFAGSYPYLSPEMLQPDHRISANSDTYTFTAFFLMFLKQDFSQSLEARAKLANNCYDLAQQLAVVKAARDEAKKNHQLKRYGYESSRAMIISGQLKATMQRLSKIPFAISDSFLSVTFPTHLVCKPDIFKSLCISAAERMQAHDPRDRYSSSDLVIMLNAAINLLVTAQEFDTNATIADQLTRHANAVDQRVHLTKFILTSCQLWRTHVSDGFDFSSFDFVVYPNFCEAVCRLYEAKSLTKDSLQELLLEQVTNDSVMLAKLTKATVVAPAALPPIFDYNALAQRYSQALDFDLTACMRLLKKQSPACLAFLSQSQQPLVDYLCLQAYDKAYLEDSIVAKSELFEPLETLQYCKTLPKHFFAASQVTALTNLIETAAKADLAALCETIYNTLKMGYHSKFSVTDLQQNLSNRPFRVIQQLRTSDNLVCDFLFLYDAQTIRLFYSKLIRNNPNKILEMANYLYLNKQQLLLAFGQQQYQLVNSIVSHFVQQIGWPYLLKMTQALRGLCALPINHIMQHITPLQVVYLTENCVNYRCAALFLLPAAYLKSYLERMPQQELIALRQYALEHAAKFSQLFSAEKYQMIKKQLNETVLKDLYSYYTKKAAQAVQHGDSYYSRSSLGYSVGQKRDAAKKLIEAYESNTVGTFFHSHTSDTKVIKAINSGELKKLSTPVLTPQLPCSKMLGG